MSEPTLFLHTVMLTELPHKADVSKYLEQYLYLPLKTGNSEVKSKLLLTTYFKN